MQQQTTPLESPATHGLWDLDGQSELNLRAGPYALPHHNNDAGHTAFHIICHQSCQWSGLESTAAARDMGDHAARATLSALEDRSAATLSTLRCKHGHVCTDPQQPRYNVIVDVHRGQQGARAVAAALKTNTTAQALKLRCRLVAVLL